MDKSCVIWTFCSLLLPCGLSQHLLTCPDVAQLDSDVLLMYTFPSPLSLFYINPDGDTVSTCISYECVNNLGPRFNGTIVNETCSFLEIEDVKISDKGEWKCRDEERHVRANCTLILSKTPTCHITSGNDTNNLDIHENISLSVNITDYYCSTFIDFLLRAGNIEEVLIKQTTVKEEHITSDVFNSTFNVTEKQIGSLELIFICNKVRKTVECGGVQTLQGRPPLCNITANRDAGGLIVDDEIAMTVYIEDYSCSRSLEFFLRTGGATNRLNVTGIYNETITFKVKESLFGPVYLDMNCNDASRNLTCDSIQQLRKRQHSPTSTPHHNSVTKITCAIDVTKLSTSLVEVDALDSYLRGMPVSLENVKPRKWPVKSGFCYPEKLGDYIPHKFVISSTDERNFAKKFTCDEKCYVCHGWRYHDGIECEVTPSFILLLVGTCVAGTLLLVGLCHLVTYLMRRKNTLCLSGNHYDGFHGRNVDARTGYDDIGIPRPQEDDTAEGGEYEMTGNQYYNLQGGNDDDTTGYVEVDIPRSRDNVNAEGAEGEASEP